MQTILSYNGKSHLLSTSVFCFFPPPPGDIIPELLRHLVALDDTSRAESPGFSDTWRSVSLTVTHLMHLLAHRESFMNFNI